jgi:hypothetical protein
MGNKPSNSSAYNSRKIEVIQNKIDKLTVFEQNDTTKKKSENDNKEANFEKIRPTSKESNLLMLIQQELENQSDLDSDSEAGVPDNDIWEKQFQFSQIVAYLNQDIKSIRSEKKLFTDKYFETSMDVLFDCSARTNNFARHLCEKLGVNAYNMRELDSKIKWERSSVCFTMQ